MTRSKPPTIAARTSNDERSPSLRQAHHRGDGGVSERNDGGHAFPNITPDMNVDGGPGMSLRDWFAGQALPVVFAQVISDLNRENGDQAGSPRDEIAQRAFAMADAMLKARSS